MRKLLLCGVLLACADPILLYVLYRFCGLLTLLALLLVPPIVGGALVSVVVSRLKQKIEAGTEAAVGFGELVMLTVARLLFWYPGPLTTLLGLLLLIRGVRRGLHSWFFMKLVKAATGGAVSVAANNGGVVFRSGPGAAQDAGSTGPIGPLKRAEGRVLETTDE
ncbi:MAG: FxsA family protein [Planctomycetota bacterium]